ncbi:UNKNOWN [Stylonychia lemnae]|uniref:Transmembrane protein n=1 Tax=Stylonychia lemnae TaxID=5949 RepID=A0A078ALM4_STYLE|nr:UNKNOWN [Stylonychia lemnae]|eukprot:CDW82771.1 UNKNOWN [Stylonychia lemnae]
MYGQTFQLTFKGDKQYKTKFGGFISTMVLFSIIAFAIFKLNVMISNYLRLMKLVKSDSKTSKNTIFKQEYIDPEIVQLSQNKFDVAFTTNQPLKPEFGEIQVFFDNQTRVYNSTTQKLNLVLCGTQHFLYQDLEEVIFKGIDKFLCIKDKSFLKTGGAFQIDFQVRYVNQYFDSNDFEQPIKAYIEDRLYLPLEYYTKKGADIFVKRNIAILQDSLIPFNPIKNLTFLQTENIKFFQADKNRRGFSILHLNIRIDFQYDIYERSIYSFSSLLSDIGGIYNALFLFGYILAFHTGSKIFYARLIREIFQATESKQDKFRKKQWQLEKPKNQDMSLVENSLEKDKENTK